MYLPHEYGDRFHLLNDTYLLSLLARIGSPETGIRGLPGLVRSAYRRLCSEVLAQEFPVVQGRVNTRMTASEPRAFYEGPLLCRNTKLIVVSVIRAGILPAQICYEIASEVVPTGHVRLDFLNISRTTDAEGHVTGVRLDGSKVGGPVDDAIVLIPDPMGATGGTIEQVYKIYNSIDGGRPRKIVAMHLMVTPESIQSLQKNCPDTEIYAGRFDRGLSPAKILDTIPGTHPDQERGLTEMQYIVPGAGGMGELLTNSWV
ncbi:MAG: uracil phosphoribosyltransferase [Planctomycetota bacterium]|nr:uracil phosphoribosyltransferase [Planctomycetota bacterium]